MAESVFMIKRVLQHFLHIPFVTNKAFSKEVQQRIADAVRASELEHYGQIRVVVEGDWPMLWLMKYPNVRSRALDVFSEMRVWDTEHNSGLLIYFLMCERKIEIVADRGLNAKVSADFWKETCVKMVAVLKENSFDKACIEAIETVTPILKESFPAQQNSSNEIDDWPIILR